MCFSVSLWDRVNPMVLGLPFNLFWLILWLILTPVCMTVVYVIVTPRVKATARTVSTTSSGSPRA
jgi:Protein of unknown function (DUF3311)